jgi:hypothetical protein
MQRGRILLRGYNEDGDDRHLYNRADVPKVFLIRH